MRNNLLWLLLLLAATLLPAPVQADDNGGWDDDWAYLDREDAFAYPEPAPSPKPDNVCPSGVNHHDSPCDCPPIEPVEYPDLPDEPMVCEHPFGDDEEFLNAFSSIFDIPNAYANSVPIYSEDPICVDPGEPAGPGDGTGYPSPAELADALQALRDYFGPLADDMINNGADPDN